MHGPHQMEDGYFRRKTAGANEIRVFQAAFLAEANRTDVPAPITLDTFGKLVHPPLEPFLPVKFFCVFHIHIVIDADLFLIKRRLVRFEIGTIRMFFKVGRTAVYMDGFHIIGV